MTKDEVKVLCKSDNQLQWWAVVLFAEISDLIHHADCNQLNDKEIANYVRSKAKEFPQLIMHAQIEKAKKKAVAVRQPDGDSGK